MNPSHAAPTLATPVGIIDLKIAHEGLAVIALLHRLHQLVLETPRRVVRHTELAMQLECRDPVLGLGEQVHREEPGPQGQLRRGQHGAARQRRLVMATMALEEPAALQSTVSTPPAFRADEPIAPSPAKQCLLALFLGSVLIEERRQTVTTLELHRIATHRKTPGLSESSSMQSLLAH